LNGAAGSFGEFQLPTLLTPSQMATFDVLTPHVKQVNIIVRMLIRSTDLDYALQEPADLPRVGAVSWYAQVFGTNGTSSDGVSLLVNTNDSSRMTISIADGVQ
jgi:hypothetical protein